MPKNRPSITCGDVRVRFVARRNANEMATKQINTPRGYVLISSPEVTAFDLVGYVDHAGGFNNVATVLAELGEVVDVDALAKTADFSPIPWAQRLGYLLDFVGYQDKTQALKNYIKDKVTETMPLMTGAEIKNVPRDSRWKLAINAEVEPDI